VKRAALLLVLCLTACAPISDATGADTTIAGRFTPERPVALTNLTLADGRYRVSYSLTIYAADRGVPRTRLSCSVIDVSGRLSDLPGLLTGVPTNQWVTVSATDVFELPDLTMGIRCYPDREADLTVVVRDVVLAAEPTG
jgi:hypothetical protein